MGLTGPGRRDLAGKSQLLLRVLRSGCSGGQATEVQLGGPGVPGSPDLLGAWRPLAQQVRRVQVESAGTGVLWMVGGDSRC